MEKREFTKNGVKYKRVQKRTAEKLYNSGVPVFAYACYMRPEVWTGPALRVCDDTDKEIAARIGVTPFQMVLNEFEFYNCNNELGRYAVFYIKNV